MKRLTASNLIRNFSKYCDVALSEPVIVTRNGRERLVLLNVDEFNYLLHAAGKGEELASEQAATAGRKLPKEIVPRSKRKA